jgi:hypothetical protein
MKMAETSQAAEITAAMLRAIPGALLGPKIAAIATNATEATIKMEVCIGLSMGAKGLVDVAVAEAVEVGGVCLKGCVVGGDLSLGGLDGGSDRGKRLSGQSDVADLGDAGSVAGDGLDAHVTLALAVDRGGDDNLKLAVGLADALAVEQVSGRDGDFEGGSGGGGPVDRLHLVWSVGLACVAQLRRDYSTR